ncbi:MAG TPA: MFS transporter, partial [Methylomirabilota bacterium]
MPRAVIVAPSVSEGARPNYKLLGLLALGHLVIDTNQGSLPALLPYLKSALGLTYAATGVIVLMANVASSLIQPLFGFLADKTARRWLLPVSVFLSAIGISLIGVAPSYYAVLALVMLGGFGVAAYHPEGYRTATQVAGERKATGVSIFSTGGNIGIAIGPPLITALVTTLGLVGSLGLLVPGVLVAGLLMAVLPGLSRPLPARTQSAALAPKTMMGAMSLLVLVIAVRSWTQIGFSTYV